MSQIRDMARDDAKKVLERHWFPGKLPVDPIHIARSLGMSVFSAELGDDTWGMIVGNSSGVDIYLDRDQPDNRYRFSCAHEIGHFIERGEELREGRALIERRSDVDRGRADEVYANEFAGSLLMPESEFRAAILQGADRWDLADMFEVSLDAVSYRRRLLNI